MCRKNESAVINLVIRNAVDYNFLSEILKKEAFFRALFAPLDNPFPEEADLRTPQKIRMPPH
ncbi:MAG: hypothetical protein CVT48_06410 [Thermoplasmata archaeon HGW-Thermoplasmata-1]|nr:MAG: hypothetical protein CVT48_06410 [Thermoplasmata archaeon HGW-Thermoplasmata-1]